MKMAISAFKKINNSKAIIKVVVAYISVLFLICIAPYIGLPINKLISIEIMSVLYPLNVLAAMISCLWAARNTMSYKRLWYLSASGMLFWLIGSTTISIYVLTTGPDKIPSPSLADITAIGYAPAILAVMFSIGRIQPPFDSRKKQFLINVLMASLAAFLLCQEFILIPAWNSEPNAGLLDKLFTITYPMFDWIILTSILFASYRFLEKQVEGWLILLATAFACSVLADIPIYITRQNVNPVTLLLLIIMSILVTLASIDEVKGSIIGTINRSQVKLSDMNDLHLLAQQSPLRTFLTPFFIVMVIPVVWLTSLKSPQISVLIRIFVSTAIMTLLLYRNHLLVSENAVSFSKALRDSLTGLNNHRYFQEALNKTIKKAEKTNRQVSLIMLDIDNFSQLNNTYGHIFGDKILTTIGSAIISNLRENDEACRLSGDEFGIILPQTRESRALTLAGRIKNSVEEALTKSFPSKVITVTLGISTYPSLAKDKDELLHTTDGALYWAKLHGKNSILLYDPRVIETLSAEERAKKVEEVAMVDMVRSLASAVDARDPYTRLHSKRVSYLSKKLARFIGLDDSAVNRIEIAGILHDVGKIGIPDNILNKPGRLTEEEMLTVKNHPLLSAQIIRSTSLKELVPAVKAHHERWDGNGYPLGLKGDNIPLEARILAIADSFDAMTSDRPYRKGLSAEEALKEINRCAGSQFDPQLAKDFLSMFNYYDFTAAYYDFNATPEESYEDQADLDYNQAVGL